MLLFHVSKGTQKNGGGGGWKEGAISELTAAGFCVLSGWRRVAQCNGQEPRQPFSKVNRTARLASSVLCLFCPLQAPPEKCWHTAAWLRAHALQMGLQAPYLCAGSAAALELLPCALLGWFSSPCFQRKSHGRCWVTATECMQLFCACCCRKLWSRNLEDSSRDLAFLFQTPVSFTEIGCVLCVRKN